MAKVHEELLVIKVSKLIKNDGINSEPLVSNTIVKEIEQVIQELVGDSIIVEIEVADL